jgi:hypothetical protein
MSRNGSKLGSAGELEHLEHGGHDVVGIAQAPDALIPPGPQARSECWDEEVLGTGTFPFTFK